MKEIVIAVVAAGLMTFGVVYVTNIMSKPYVPAAPGVGALAGPEVYEHQFFNENITVGGGIRATSTNDTTATLLASDMDFEKVIDFTPLVPGITLAFPASSTLPNFLPNAGDTRTLFIRNATTTAATSGNVTIAGGTGTLLKNASSSPSVKVLKGDTDAGNYARFDIIRKANRDFEVLMQTFID